MTQISWQHCENSWVHTVCCLNPMHKNFKKSIKIMSILLSALALISLACVNGCNMWFGIESVHQEFLGSSS